ncbi:MAG: hypothetical protein MHM6MM_002713 [Cercozoa sp. M6MM]
MLATSATARLYRGNQADVRAPAEMMEQLRQSALWREDSRKVWLLEGLVYYISEKETIALIKAIMERGDLIVVDFARPNERVVDYHREAMTNLCANQVARSVGCRRIHRMNLQKVAALSNARIVLNETMHEIERMLLKRGELTGHPRYADPLGGMLSVAVLGPMGPWLL